MLSLFCARPAAAVYWGDRRRDRSRDRSPRRSHRVNIGLHATATARATVHRPTSDVVQLYTCVNVTHMRQIDVNVEPVQLLRQMTDNIGRHRAVCERLWWNSCVLLQRCRTTSEDIGRRRPVCERSFSQVCHDVSRCVKDGSCSLSSLE